MCAHPDDELTTMSPPIGPSCWNAAGYSGNRLRKPRSTGTRSRNDVRIGVSRKPGNVLSGRYSDVCSVASGQICDSSSATRSAPPRWLR